MSTAKKPSHPSLLDTIKSTIFVPLHPAGSPFIIAGAIFTFFFFLASVFAGMLFLILTLFCIYFFRDPVRVTPTRAGLVVSPADGLVTAIVTNQPLPKEIAEPGDTSDYTRVSIFLSVFDVHVNRSPVTGEVLRDAYVPGKFVNAALDKASEDNERAIAKIRTPEGKIVAVVQIAGLVARRIITTMKQGRSFKAGERYGIIRFGSRGDVYLPAGVSPLVIVGQRAIGGETIIADLTSAEAPRQGISQ
jgi:phosphatidylserine decarboxylase